MPLSPSRNMTPPPSYHSILPPSYHTLYPPDSTLPTYSASTDFVQGPSIPRSNSARCLHLLSAVSAFFFYICALVLLASRYSAYLVYAQNSEDFASQVPDLLVSGLIVVVGLAVLICFGIHRSLQKIYAMMTEPGQVTEEETLMTEV
ncbi:hypothetical protein M409DRAFT_56593 [Zasmidium cellare ATCC 36951]|uniref:Uncharacterized protein n=1 Tax=Zasmidium cellare ATCC 36951 TaxID=1080233 RepID=A0A6A6CB96_ZASCE|nr:uncharacterized protein M409DRAFT_56593 [Zasmidium cellare ATCC 36951]KAF2164311.1 hypothetical protein M409DRAFT_56593 [Zasmidium cellare ATCC 36951]